MMQVGVIVAGVLAAGLWVKAATTMKMPLPFPVLMLYNYGVLGFFIPIFWSAFTLILLHRPEISDEIKALAFWFGVLLVVALAVFVSYADVTPWMIGTKDLSGDDIS
jgi:hypothetical protein